MAASNQWLTTSHAWLATFRCLSFSTKLGNGRIGVRRKGKPSPLTEIVNSGSSSLLLAELKDVLMDESGMLTAFP